MTAQKMVTLITGKNSERFRPSPFMGLPFVGFDAEGYASFWMPRPSGDYTFDCDLGELYGKALLPHLTSSDGPWLLGAIASDIAQYGDYGRDHGLLIGLFNHVGRAMQGAMAPRGFAKGVAP